MSSFESHNKSSFYKSSLTEEEREKEWLRIFNKSEYNKLYGEEEDICPVKMQEE